jgi:hypothetical protein
LPDFHVLINWGTKDFCWLGRCYQYFDDDHDFPCGWSNSSMSQSGSKVSLQSEPTPVLKDAIGKGTALHANGNTIALPRSSFSAPESAKRLQRPKTDAYYEKPNRYCGAPLVCSS